MASQLHKLGPADDRDLNRDFEIFLEQTTDFIYFKDAESRFLFCSQTIADITGHASWRDLIGKHDSEVFPPETARVYEEEERPIFAKGKALLNKVDPFYDAEGRLGYVQTNKWPLFDDEGNVIGIFGVSRDITEQRRAEEEREQYFKFFNVAADLMVIAEPGGNFTKVNPTSSRVLGYSEAELLAKPWIEFVHPDDRAATEAEIARQLRGSRSLGFENRYLCKDGSVRHLSWKAYNNPADGLTYAAARDITERKKMEAALRESESLLQEAQRLGRVGGWQYDVESKTIHWTNEVYRIYEVDRSFDPNDVDGSVARYAPEAQEVLRQAFEAAVENGKPYDLELGFIGARGTKKWVRTQARPIVESGRVVRVVGNIVDMTECKQLAEDLRAAVELRDEFMSIASHELKTPLTSLLVQLELLSTKTATDQQAQVTALSSRPLASARRLNALLDELLDVTRIRVGKLTLEKEAVDLTAAAEEAVAHTPGVVRKYLQSGVVGNWDPRRIRQIIDNLLSNAVKYGGGKPIEVTLTAEPGSGIARLSVRDRGVGIPKEMQAIVFERYQRAVSDDKIKGLGLGLYIVRQIVEAHGGSIRVESEPGEGALFTVELPLESP